MPIVHNLFSFEGRLRRRDFWVGMLILFVASWIVNTVLAMSFGSMFYAANPGYVGGGAPAAVPWAFMSGMGAAWGIVCLLMLWPSLALAVKRCHDRGKSGIWVLISFIPLIGFFWWLIDLGILEGTPGPNQYGPSPKGVGGASELPA